VKSPQQKRQRWADPRTWLALVSAALVTWLALKTVQSEPGPGPLSKAHSGLPELEGPAGCVACHGAGAEGMRAACSACHGPIEQQLAARTGFHGTLADGADCARCHSEHHGAASAPYTRATFQLAGFTERDVYDHRGLDYGLHGAHAALACNACHAAADAPSGELAPAAREPGLRFLGLSQACAVCHADPHAGRLGADCAACHGQTRPFPEAAAFVHTASFALEGAHSGLVCVACHPRESAFEIEAYRGEDHAVRGCAECHTSPHSAPFEATQPAGCAACHSAVPGGFRAAPRAVAAAAHAAIGNALSGVHATVDCAACHRADAPFAAAHPGRMLLHCADCHADPHRSELGDPAVEPATCARCHSTDTPFAQHRFDAAAHAAAGFPLAGAHAALACAACHSAAPLGFRAAPTRCADCHTDPHAGRFAAAQDCSTCHSTASFREQPAPFDHARWTGFALDGAHAALACGVCHPSEPGSQRLGPVAAVFVPGETRENLAACTACHSDPHGGAFRGATAALGLVTDGQRGCARCHTTAGFREVEPSRFDHGAWTGFELTGAHVAGACTACHGAATDRRLGRVSERFPGPVERCETCHVDPHAGRFDAHAPAQVDTRSGCNRCHGEVSFRALSAFDHAWTGHPLVGAHAALACDACHAPSAQRAPGGVLGPVHGRRCADCHDDPHGGQFTVEGAVDCARCHAAERPFNALAFDHTQTRFPLDPTHAALACDACHRAATTRDGRVLVRYRPLGTQCADCHGTAGQRAPGPRIPLK